MAKLDRARLRETFDTNLADIWEAWENYVGESGNPFKDNRPLTDSDMETESLFAIMEQIGFVEGIHQATGWPLVNPRGKKEWRPR